MSCIFCRIIRNESPAEIIYSNDHAIALLDINPIHYGHALVIPRTHSITFLEVPAAELAGLMEAVSVVTRAIVECFRPEGFNIFSNNGEAAGQSVFHCHFHITPRYTDDNIKFILKLKKYPDNRMVEYAANLRRHIHNPTQSKLP